MVTNVTVILPGDVRHSQSACCRRHSAAARVPTPDQEPLASQPTNAELQFVHVATYIHSSLFYYYY